MEVRYSIELDPIVIEKDIPRIDASWRAVIRDTVRQKLTTKPELYGKRLRQDLKGCWKLRVGNYRVVYQINVRIIRIIAIIHRSTDYSGVEKRV